MTAAISSPTVFDGIDALRAAAGVDLGATDWMTIDQARVDLFAEATGDHQWIHVDPVRAAAESPFGGPIAHGYLTLALTNLLLPQLLEVRGISMGVNYGVDKVRFPAPVPVGARIRARATITAVADVPGGVQATITITVEVESDEPGIPTHKPACIVESLSRFLI